MKFKCTLSGCVYTFTSPLDIASMLKSTDYTVVVDEVIEPVKAGPVLTTIAPVSPVKASPDKPLPTPLAAKAAV